MEKTDIARTYRQLLPNDERNIEIVFVFFVLDVLSVSDNI